MFSPSFIISALRNSSTFSPFGKVALESASVSVKFLVAVNCARFLANLIKSSFLATKSVSQLTSTRAPLFLSTAISTPIVPSAVIRLAAVLAFAPLFIRNKSSAVFRSPPVSINAFLHSIMPSPVRSRNSFTMLAVISAMFTPDTKIG